MIERRLRDILPLNTFCISSALVITFSFNITREGRTTKARAGLFG